MRLKDRLRRFEVLNREPLTPYGHVYAIYRHGKQMLKHPKKTCPGKLLWVFAKGKANLKSHYRGLLDVGDPNRKEDHEWQQPIGEAEQIVEDFTFPGDLIVDSCVGPGTAAIAAAAP
jgi:DNA modification methylase